MAWNRNFHETFSASFPYQISVKCVEIFKGHMNFVYVFIYIDICYGLFCLKKKKMQNSFCKKSSMKNCNKICKRIHRMQGELYVNDAVLWISMAESHKYPVVSGDKFPYQI
jgi:hypothetical protein